MEDLLFISTYQGNNSNFNTSVTRLYTIVSVICGVK